MNYSASTRNRIADITLGLRVDRATAVVPQTAHTIFTVAGGRVVLLELVGEATSTLAGATTLLVSHIPTSGASVTVALSIACLSINGKLAGTKFTLPAAAGSALTMEADGGGAVMLSANPTWLLNIGALTLTAGGAPNTGYIKWTAVYVPFDTGAYVVAA